MFNFENIGGKIKTLAVITTIIGIALSFIFGLLIIEEKISTGLFIIIGGCVLSWISAFFMYRFGELIEKTTEIARNTKKDIKVEIINESNTKKTDD